MSNSKLISYTKISPYSTNPRESPIKKITIHHMAGNLTVEECGEVFQSSGASANYGVGSDGRRALYVDEKNRAHTSSSPENDAQAVTIEVANDGGADTDWHVSDKALSSLIELCVDICRRNNISKLNYTGDATGNLTRHNMFDATTCPGPYLQSKFPYIAEQVNKKLKEDDDMTEAEVRKIAQSEVQKAFDISGTGNNPSSWAKTACDWCIKEGIFSGDNGDYGWQKAITREQAALLIYNAYNKK